MKRYLRNITVLKKHDRKRDKIYEQYLLTLPKEVGNKLGKLVEIIDFELDLPIIIVRKVDEDEKPVRKDI